jgi:hypothetical protein
MTTNSSMSVKAWRLADMEREPSRITTNNGTRT